MSFRRDSQWLPSIYLSRAVVQPGHYDEDNHWAVFEFVPMVDCGDDMRYRTLMLAATGGRLDFRITDLASLSLIMQL
jgi:hypothetical protein